MTDFDAARRFRGSSVVPVTVGLLIGHRACFADPRQVGYARFQKTFFDLLCDVELSAVCLTTWRLYYAGYI